IRCLGAERSSNSSNCGFKKGRFSLPSWNAKLDHSIVTQISSPNTSEPPKKRQHELELSRGNNTGDKDKEKAARYKAANDKVKAARYKAAKDKAAKDKGGKPKDGVND
ncbi:hypothetical protein SARC_03545, partial [Sphaeroforma arctica JP610]